MEASKPGSLEDGTESMESSLSDSFAFQFEGLSIPVFGVATDGSLISWNRSLAELSGIPPATAVGKEGGVKASSFMAGGANQWQQALLSTLSERNARCQIDLKCASGALKGFSVNLVAQTSPSGDTIAVICFLEECATTFGDSSQHHVTTLLKSLPMPILGVDRDSVVRLWNAKMTHLSGFDASETEGQTLLENLLPSPSSNLHEALQKAMEGSTVSNLEVEITHKSQESRFLLVSVLPWRNEPSAGSEIVGAVLIGHDVTVAAWQERVVSQQATELRQLLDTCQSPFFGVDTSGRINEWNECMVETTGFGADEAFGANFCVTFLQENRRAVAESILKNALNGKGTTNVDMDVRTKFGDARSFLLSASTRRNIRNEIVGAFFVAQDTTESAKHDRAVASMASELRQLIDTANAPIFGIDCDGDVNEWNDKTAEITGHTKEEAFDCPLVESFIVPHMQDSVRGVLESARLGRGTSNYELEFRTKSNEIRHLLVNATTRRDAENNVVGVVGVAQDVTEAVQRDRAVAGMALELRQLIDTANAPIFGIDIDGNVNEWNKRTQEITGYSKEETFDEPLVGRFIAPSMRQKVQEILDSALHGNETSNYELEFVAKSGESRFMLVNATTRRDPEFNVVGVVGVAQDVTEDRKHATELREMHYVQATQEAKVETERNMTAYFAHELRNPLGAIDSALNSMPEELPETARSLVAGMQLCTSFMSSVMNNLLDVRKMEEGMLKLTRSPLSLSSLLSNVHKMLMPSVKPGVEFTAHSDTRGRDWVLGDEHRLQQVMTNVVTNAIKYTLSGSIVISVGWVGDSVKFECLDTGPGIPKKEQGMLFERFVQRGGAPGTGLGLAIAKHIVNLTGGTIRFESDPTIKAGTSCVVEMSLPFCDARENAKIGTAGEKFLEEELRFLIIDDVKMNRMMLRKRLHKGIAPRAVISEACTGEEALAICGKEKFDVIVVDQYMEEAGGVMVGTDVVYAMRRMRIESIIIGCSGNDLDDEFSEAGADWVWQKPMPQNSEIISHLRAALLLKRGR
jgi:PAS domain S-box-containing protein